MTDKKLPATPSDAWFETEIRTHINAMAHYDAAQIEAYLASGAMKTQAALMPVAAHAYRIKALTAEMSTGQQQILRIVTDRILGPRP
jgi:uncharacterized protein YhaN